MPVTDQIMYIFSEKLWLRLPIDFPIKFVTFLGVMPGKVAPTPHS
jgi:hypothetical protein